MPVAVRQKRPGANDSGELGGETPNKIDAHPPHPFSMAGGTVLKSLTLQNFKGYEQEHIEFGPGINAVVGASDRGKSNLLRSFLWIWKNRPLGGSVLSYWNRNEKGEAVGITSAYAEFDSGATVGRLRGKDRQGASVNQYQVIKGGYTQPLDADVREVPSEALAIIGMTDVNVQRQHDGQFLIASSAGDVAQWFNSLVHLDLIDKLQEVVDARKRQYKAEKKRAEQEEDTQSKAVQGYDWVDEVAPLLKQATILDEHISECEQRQKRLDLLLSQIIAAEEVAATLDYLPAAEKLADRIAAITVAIDEQLNRKNRLQALITEYNRQEKQLENMPDMAEAEEICGKIMAITDRINEKVARINSLARMLDYWDKAEADITRYGQEIDALRAKLPETCPYCGAELRGDSIGHTDHNQ